MVPEVTQDTTDNMQCENVDTIAETRRTSTRNKKTQVLEVMIFYGKQDTRFEKQSFFCSASKCSKRKQQIIRTRPGVKVESMEH
jgi:UTP:GlnB (protein PII) uridylyltransferase